MGSNKSSHKKNVSINFWHFSALTENLQLNTTPGEGISPLIRKCFLGDNEWPGNCLYVSQMVQVLIHHYAQIFWPVHFSITQFSSLVKLLCLGTSPSHYWATNLKSTKHLHQLAHIIYIYIIGEKYEKQKLSTKKLNPKRMWRCRHVKSLSHNVWRAMLKWALCYPKQSINCK